MLRALLLGQLRACSGSTSHRDLSPPHISVALQALEVFPLLPLRAHTPALLSEATVLRQSTNDLHDASGQETAEPHPCSHEHESRGAILWVARHLRSIPSLQTIPSRSHPRSLPRQRGEYPS